MITWGAPIWLYLWLAGMAGGAYFGAFLAERRGAGADRRLLRIATYLGIPLAISGVALLIIDLGQPLRFWHLMVNFNVTSPMSMGTWILLVWVGIAIMLVIAWRVERHRAESVSRNLRRLIEVLVWIDFIFAIFLMSYTGVLLAASSQPMWAGTLLLPSLFVVSAVSTGIAILAFTVLITRNSWNIPNRMVSRLIEADAVVIIIELAVLVGYIIWLTNGAMPGTHQAMRLLTTGVLAARFWFGVVLLALLIPLGLNVAHWGKDIKSKRSIWGSALASSACVILGAMVLRLVMVVGGQMA
ncbi:NrfD/PsrC family molybdoenzyme membrane anchor subunit [Chloroflexota bacterium]